MLSGVAEKLYAAVPGSKAQLVHYMPNVYSEEQRAFFAREASARKAQVSFAFLFLSSANQIRVLTIDIDGRRSRRKHR